MLSFSAYFMLYFLVYFDRNCLSTILLPFISISYYLWIINP